MINMIAHKIRHLTSHLTLYMQVLLLATPIAFGTMPFVSAAELTTRSISLSTARAGEPAQHTFIF